MSAEAKQVAFSPEKSLESVIAEIKAHLTAEINGVKGLVQERPLVGARKCAEFLGIHEKTFYKWVKDEVLPSGVVHHLGSAIFCYPSELNAYVKSK